MAVSRRSVVALMVVLAAAWVGQAAFAQGAEAKAATVDLGGDVKMEFVYIAPGSFTMGDDKGTNEKPAHKVTLSKGFFLGKCEVTQEQWDAVMGQAPTTFKGPKAEIAWEDCDALMKKLREAIPGKFDLTQDQWQAALGKVPCRFKGAKNPVERVSWDECQEFLKKLGEKAKGKGFRLPTEAEWEYACRAGTTTAYACGDDEAALKDHVWYIATSEAKTHPVGEKKANAWGLLDMHGNVWEWCADRYGAYSKDDQTDPVGVTEAKKEAEPKKEPEKKGGAKKGKGAAPKAPPLPTERVIRGGAWGSLAPFVRSATRSSCEPDTRGDFLGFRVVLVAEEK